MRFKKNKNLLANCISRKFAQFFSASMILDSIQTLIWHCRALKQWQFQGRLVQMGKEFRKCDKGFTVSLERCKSFEEFCNKLGKEESDHLIAFGLERGCVRRMPRQVAKPHLADLLILCRARGSPLQRLHRSQERRQEGGKESGGTGAPGKQHAVWGRDCPENVFRTERLHIPACVIGGQRCRACHRYRHCHLVE